MILEIDYGNTRLKWRLLDAGSSVCVVRGAVDHISRLALALTQAGCEFLVFCRVCSVRNAADNALLVQVVELLYGGTPVVFARSATQQCGVVNGYLEPSLLGVDRWLVVLAAYAQVQGNCIVIDFGTAITADLITTDGAHLGGCIAPGIKMLNTALLGGTQIYLETNTAEKTADITAGCSTGAAIYAGIYSMVVGFLREQLKLAAKMFGADFAVVCTGGDSELIKAIVPSALIQDDLVFTGLALACPYHIKG